MVRSIKQHKNFRQLASYSVQCLQKVITPPHVGWEQNMKEAFESGALEAITEVLQKHKGDSAVLASSTACLSSLASKPEYAGKLVESGALFSMVDSVVSNPDGEKGVKETLQLLDTVATNNPEALLKHGGVDAAIKLLNASDSNPALKAAAMRTLEKVNKVPGGCDAIVAAGALPDLLELIRKKPDDMPTPAFAKGADDDESEPVDMDFLSPSFRLLDRMCRNPAQADALRGANGMQLLCEALDIHKDNLKVCKIGGRVLSKLASGNVSDLIARLQGSKGEERAFLTQLLANLALEEDNADKIVKAGGVQILIQTFDSPSKTTIQASARALARIASNDENVQELVKADAIGVLVRVINTHSNDADITSAITPTLLKLATQPENVELIAAEGGINVVLATLAEHPEFEDFVAHALKFLENLAIVDFDMTELVQANAIASVLTGMRTHPTNATIRLNGTRVLIYMGDSAANIRSIMDNGAKEVVETTLKAEKPDRETVLATMYLLGSVSLVPEFKRTFMTGECGDALLAAIAAFKDDEFKKQAQEVVEIVADEAQIVECMSEISMMAQGISANPSLADSKRLIAFALRAGAFSVVPRNAEAMIRSDGVKSLVAAIESVATANNVPMQEAILAACSSALLDISNSVANDEELRMLLGTSGAVKAVITAVKNHPKLKGNVEAAIAFLESYAKIEECAGIIEKEGGIEACVCALRANQTNSKVVGFAVATMLQLAVTDKGAVSVAKHGGTRQVISTILANTGTPGFSAAMGKCLQLLQRVAMSQEGADVLIKQGAVDAVIAAADALGDQSDVVKASAGLLAKLLTQDDVEAAVEALAELGAKASKGRLPPVDALKPVLSRIAHMSRVGTHGDLVTRLGGQRAIAAIMRTTLSHDDAQVKAEILPTAFRAVESLAEKGLIDPSLGFAEMMSTALAEGLATIQVLSTISQIADADKGAAQAIVADGKTLPAIVSTLQGNLRAKDTARACFDALSALAGYDETAGPVGDTAALRLVQDWLDDNTDENDPEGMQSALNLIANLARDPRHATALLDAGFLELGKTIIGKCTEGGQSGVFAGMTRVMKGLAAAPGGFEKLKKSGVIKRMFRALQSQPALIRDANCMKEMFSMIGDLSKDPATAQFLLDQGADELISQAMNKNGNSKDMLMAGAAAMASLGCGPQTGRAALDEVKALSNKLEDAELITQEMVIELGDAVQRMSNLMMVEGIVTADNAADVMNVMSNAVALLAESELAPPSVLAGGVQALGRLAAMENMGSSDLPIEDCVEMVLDVMSLNPDDKLIREAAIHALGEMSKNSIALKCIAEQGVIDMLVDLAKKHPGDGELQSLVQDAIKKITTNINTKAGELSRLEGGEDAVAAVIKANSADAHALSECLMSMCEVEGGEYALYAALSAEATRGDNRVAAEALRILRERHDRSGVGRIQGTPQQIRGLVQALQSALAVQINPTSDERSRLQALRIADNALTLMAATGMDEATALALAASGGMQSLMQLLAANFSDPEAAGKLIRVLRSAMEHINPDGAALCATKDNMQAIMATLRSNMPDAPIVDDCVTLMDCVCDQVGASESGIDREGMRLTGEARDTHPDHENIQNRAGALLGKLGAIFSDEPAELMREKLGEALGAIGDASTIQEHVTEDGRKYYYDTATGETMWEPPAAYSKLLSRLNDMANLAASQQEDSVVSVDGNTIAQVVGAMSAHGRNADIAKACAETLSMLSLDDGNCEAIARNGGIRAIIAAIRLNPDNLALLKLLLVLLEKISRNDVFKELIAQEGGIGVVIDIGIMRHTDVEEVVVKCLSTLANLAFNSSANIGRIMEQNGVKAAEKAMQQYPDAPRLLENAMCMLSNLMYGSDENKLNIGQTCGDEITHIIRVHHEDGNLFKMALRALGNLSYCDENIRFIVDEGATAVIVTGMKSNAKDEEGLQLAMEVLGNFASLEDEEDLEEGQDPVPIVIYEEGGTEQV